MMEIKERRGKGNLSIPGTAICQSVIIHFLKIPPASKEGLVSFANDPPRPFFFHFWTPNSGCEGWGWNLVGSGLRALYRATLCCPLLAGEAEATPSPTPGTVTLLHLRQREAEGLPPAPPCPLPQRNRGGWHILRKRRPSPRRVPLSQEQTPLLMAGASPPSSPTPPHPTPPRPTPSSAHLLWEGTGG